MTRTTPALAATRRPTRGLTRWMRVACLGGVSLMLATTAHLIGGGVLPSAGVLVVTAFLLGLVSTTLTARRCRARVLVGVLTVQQVLLHLLFGAAAAVRVGCGQMSTSEMGHAMHLAVQACDPSVMASMDMSDAAMWTSHLAATVVTALLLARGEAWLWRVTDEIVAAATAGPAGWPEAAPVRVAAGRPGSARVQLGHRAAAPRAPPSVPVVS